MKDVLNYSCEVFEPVNFCDLFFGMVHFGNIFNIQDIKDIIKYICIEDNVKENGTSTFKLYHIENMDSCCTTDNVYFILTTHTSEDRPCLRIFKDRDSAYRYGRQLNLLNKLKTALLNEDCLQHLFKMCGVCFHCDEDDD